MADKKKEKKDKTEDVKKEKSSEKTESVKDTAKDAKEAGGLSSSDNVAKILVEDDDEITFIVEQLEEIKVKRVVISIPEGNDLLVSSVGMRLLAQHADEQEKLLTVVTDDNAGRNMARIAGLGVARAMDEVSEDVWLEAQNAKRIREDAGEVVDFEDQIADAPVEGEPGGLVNKDAEDNIEEAKLEEKSAVEEDVDPMDLGRPRGVAAGAAVGAGVVAAGAVASANAAEAAGTAEAAGAAAVGSMRTVKKGAFEMTIDEGGSSKKPVGKVQPVPKPEPKSSAGLVGRDFASYESGGVGISQADDVPVKDTGAKSSDKTKKKLKLGEFVSKLPLIGSLVTGKKGKKLLIPAFIAILAVVAGLYWSMPEVVVEIDVESIPVEYTGEVTALVSADEVDEEKLVIPARSEVETNNGSESAAATGTAVRGEKASGTVTIYNKTDEDITVASGTLLSNGGLGFVLQEEVVVPQRPDPIGMGSVSGDVIAQEVGTEYNIAAGTTLTVGAVALSELSATNAVAFSGGTKEEYSVVSQADIDGVASSLQEQLYKDSEKKLSEKHKGTKWTYVKESLKNELDGNVTSDVPAGAEQSSVNVDVKTKSTALYYDSDALDELIEVLLLKDFGEDELEGIELSDTIEKVVTVKSASVDEKKIVLSVSVTGFVMPQLDTEQVEKDLQGMSWAEGTRYLKELDYASGDPKVKFYPEWFPRFAWHMPSRGGRITVNVKNVVPEEEEAPAADGGEGDAGTPVEAGE